MTNPTEMHADTSAVVATLAKDKTLREKFSAAFGSPEFPSNVSDSHLSSIC